MHSQLFCSQHLSVNLSFVFNLQARGPASEKDLSIAILDDNNAILIISSVLVKFSLSLVDLPNARHCKLSRILGDLKPKRSCPQQPHKGTINDMKGFYSHNLQQSPLYKSGYSPSGRNTLEEGSKQL